MVQPTGVQVFTGGAAATGVSSGYWLLPGLCLRCKMVEGFNFVYGFEYSVFLPLCSRVMV